ncbi:uncharacterized protein CTRU02_206445 [Colletotrichum truncatum]|uniref:Uncharacterized protein n=1 Tax=Colletotrichum truncatum TaxID=5467 RepID=A0ACC3Z6Z5_COLTU
MPDGNMNPGVPICTSVGGKPAPDYQPACCGVDEKQRTYEIGCQHNGGVRAQYTYYC